MAREDQEHPIQIAYGMSIVTRVKRPIKTMKRYLRQWFADAETKRSRRRIRRLRKVPGVDIHRSVELGSLSEIIIKHPIAGLSLGKNMSCRKFCNFLMYENARLTIGENVFFNNYCSVNCLAHIEIGANTIFGEGVKLYDHNHAYDRSENKINVHRDKFTSSAIVIGKNCWIASNVTILKGVTIGDNVIIGANCLIHTSIPSNAVVRLDQRLTVESRT